MKARAVHRSSTILLCIYILVHLANHIVGIFGVDRHIAFMSEVRLVYRQPAVEALLIILFLAQMLSGGMLAKRAWRSASTALKRMQILAGLYLIFFLSIHISAVLMGRLVSGLDTNFFFAAAGLHVFPFSIFFAPYYFLAVLAIFVHLGCAAYYAKSSSESSRRALVIGVFGVGAVTSLLIVMSLAGALYPLRIPADYLKTFQLPVARAPGQAMPGPNALAAHQ